MKEMGNWSLGLKQWVVCQRLVEIEDLQECQWFLTCLVVFIFILPRFRAFNFSISPCRPASMSWCWSCKNRMFCSKRTCSGVLEDWSSLFWTSCIFGAISSLLIAPGLVLLTWKFILSNLFIHFYKFCLKLFFTGLLTAINAYGKSTLL